MLDTCRLFTYKYKKRRRYLVYLPTILPVPVFAITLKVIAVCISGDAVGRNACDVILMHVPVCSQKPNLDG